MVFSLVSFVLNLYWEKFGMSWSKIEKIYQVIFLDLVIFVKFWHIFQHFWIYQDFRQFWVALNFGENFTFKLYLSIFFIALTTSQYQEFSDDLLFQFFSDNPPTTETSNATEMTASLAVVTASKIDRNWKKFLLFIPFKPSLNGSHLMQPTFNILLL